MSTVIDDLTRKIAELQAEVDAEIAKLSNQG